MTSKRKKDRIAIIGLGKVGSAIGFLLRKAGYPIAAVADRSPEAIRHGHPFTGGHIHDRISDVVPEADAIFIATTDDAILEACREVSASGFIRPGQKFVHLSGAGSLDLLAPAKNAGASIASIHPIQSFADVQGAIEHIPGSTFGLTSDESIKNWAVDVILDLKGIPFLIPDKDKALYHAAACIASNYLTALMYMVEEIYQTLGLTREEAIRAFWPLVRGTLQNIESRGTIEALTGPIARGDLGTIEKHVLAFHEKMPFFLDAYRIMGIIATELGLKKQSLSADRAEAITELLKGVKHEHTS
ncbi:MAG: hypothetical protein CSYNP_01445 [Syntrophus sp. SKADARSKE-3]|nr:hypothetical protein [Syntrophus sp. SKADARSKE-3]